MTTALVSVPQAISPEAMEKVMLQGDLASLAPKQRLEYMAAVCSSLGLNPLTKPFEFITLNGKLRLYALHDCTDQLRKLHGVSIAIVSRDVTDDICVVTAQATDRTGRRDEAIGALDIKGLRGLDRANALMKTETKAKRRVTLSICGLGVLDESEVEESRKAEPPPPLRYTEAERADIDGFRGTMGGDTIPDPPDPDDEPPADTLATPPQVKAIKTLQGKVGLTDDRYRARLWGTYKVRSSKDLTVTQASDFVDVLQKMLEQRERTHANMEATIAQREPGSDDETGEVIDAGQLQEVKEAAQARWGGAVGQDGPAWLVKHFGVNSAANLTKTQATKALQMLIAGQ